MKIWALFLSVVLICGMICGCKDKKDNEDTSSAVSSVTSVASEVPAMAGDTILDPQGGENGRPLGATVNISDVKPKSGVHNGIDVSKWQGKIDWSKVKNAGIDFAVIRIGFRGENGKIY